MQRKPFVLALGLVAGASGIARAGAWTVLPPMPQARWCHTAGVGSDGKIYVYGGYVDVGGRREAGRNEWANVVWDPKTRTWETGPPSARARVIQRDRSTMARGAEEKGYVETDYPHENPVDVEMPLGQVDPAGDLFWYSGMTWLRLVPKKEAWESPFPPAWIKNPAWKPGTSVQGTFWVEHAPAFGRYSPSTATVGDKIYVTGGLALGADDPRPMVHASAEVYESDTGTWWLLPPMHQKRYLHAAAETRDGQVCVFGGSAAEPSMMQEPGESGESHDRRAAENRPLAKICLASVECYDPKTNAWTERAPLPTPRQAMGAALGANGKIYVVGGAPSYAHPRPMEVVEVDDPEADAWSPGPRLTYPRRGHAVVSTKEGKIYAIGGWVGRPARSVLGRLLGPKVDRPLGATAEVLDTGARP